MGLTAKLILALSGLSAIVLSGAMAILYFAENRHLTAQIESAQRTALEKLAAVCRDSLINEDELSRLTYLKTFWNSSEPGLLSYAALTDEKGRVLMHSDFLRGDLTRKGTLLREPEAPDGVVLSQAVSVQGHRVGTAILAYRKEAVARAARRLQRETLARLGEASLGGIALSLLFAALLARGLIRPIRELHAGAVRLGQGQLGYRIPALGQDELGDLAREFNLMGERLAELDALKDSFLAQVTHDLRNPLATITGRIELLLMGVQGSVTEQQGESLQVALRNAGYLNGLIENILDLTKLEAGRMEFRPAEIPLREMVDSVHTMLKVKADEFSIKLDASGVQESVRVWADEQALRRVLVNLVSNALKFTPIRGSVRVRHSRTEAGEDRVAVEDTGVGIPKDKLGELFKKFFQVPETKEKARGAPGTGLGLVICKQIVEAHGGRIGAESEYQRGATFYFTLPPKTAFARSKG